MPSVYVLKVCGYRRGSRVKTMWFMIFDSGGYTLLGREDESRSALEIRWVETRGVPTEWTRYDTIFSPGQAEDMRDRIIYPVKVKSKKTPQTTEVAS